MNDRCAVRLVLAVTGVMSMPALAADAAKERALVIVDQYCERVVQPYKLSDNVLGTIGAGLKGLGGSVMKKLGQQDAEESLEAEQEMRRKAVHSNWMPMKAETMFGERHHSQQQDNVLDPESKLGKPAYALAQTMLDEMTVNLGEKQPYDLKIFVLKNDTRNAMASPGGYLYIDRGLLASPQYQDKARFALAHELAHVWQRHETRALQGLVVDSYATQKELRAGIRSLAGKPENLLKRVTLEKDTYVRHEIDQELQADACAVRILDRAYPNDPKVSMAIEAFLKDLPKNEAAPKLVQPAKQPAPIAGAPSQVNQAVQVNLLTQELVKSPASRHPTSAERVSNLETAYVEVKQAK